MIIKRYESHLLKVEVFGTWTRQDGRLFYLCAGKETEHLWTAKNCVVLDDSPIRFQVCPLVSGQRYKYKGKNYKRTRDMEGILKRVSRRKDILVAVINGTGGRETVWQLRSLAEFPETEKPAEVNEYPVWPEIPAYPAAWVR